MVFTRGSALGRILVNQLRTKLVQTPQNQIIRQSHAWSYRTGPPAHSKVTVIGANMVGGLMWWWVLWHLWHEYEHITGEFEYPDPSKWTNAELGIPADSVDE
ncbi:unnamed protein product [Diamesa hyperborea]